MSVLRDHEAERILLASILQHPGAMTRLLSDEGLRPEHFAVEGHGVIFAALVAILDRGEHVGAMTLRSELERSADAVPPVLLDAVFSEIPDPSSVWSCARRIRDLQRRRQVKLAAELLSRAADTGNPDELAEAERLLSTPEDSEPATWSPLDLAELYARRLEEPAPETFRWPFSRLDAWTGGGLRRKQVVLVGGWTAMGKSILYDQILERLAAQGLRVHSYINEMSEAERMDRTMARLSGVPFPAIQSHRLTADQKVTVFEALGRVQVGMTECAGWSADEIARHIRWNRWDVAGVDIIHEIAHRDERDLAEVAQTLRAAAKQTGCALIACVHLNDNRVTAPQRPRPVLRDVRGSGMLTRGADIVLLIHRDDDEDGVPTNDGMLLAPKIRQGQPSVMGVRFQPEQMRFVSTVEA